MKNYKLLEQTVRCRTYTPRRKNPRIHLQLLIIKKDNNWSTCWVIVTVIDYIDFLSPTNVDLIIVIANVFTEIFFYNAMMMGRWCVLYKRKDHFENIVHLYTYIYIGDVTDFVHKSLIFFYIVVYVFGIVFIMLSYFFCILFFRYIQKDYRRQWVDYVIYNLSN